MIASDSGRADDFPKNEPPGEPLAKPPTNHFTIPSARHKTAFVIVKIIKCNSFLHLFYTLLYYI